MSSLDDKQAEYRLLATVRQTLSYLLVQEAKHLGGYVPPVVLHGIDDARVKIQSIKQALRARGETVDDLPIDTAISAASEQKSPVILGSLLLWIINRVSSWQIAVENSGEQEIVGLRLTLRPDAALFVSTTSISMPRIASRSRVQSQPITISGPIVSIGATRGRSMSMDAQHGQFERQRVELVALIGRTRSRITRLEEQRSLAAGREQLQREAEIESFQNDLKNYEKQLDDIDARLATLIAYTSDESVAPEPKMICHIPFDVTYHMYGQIERSNGVFELLI